jgi:hypothetical protein
MGEKSERDNHYTSEYRNTKPETFWNLYPLSREVQDMKVKDERKASMLMTLSS